MTNEQLNQYYSSGSAKEKIESLEAAGIRVAQEPSDIPKLLKK